ncbi:ABC transporter permease subunit [Mycoplasmopsis bovis]|uniref:ABC transporter permease subunit n=3 Tax=Mycoplasmopsis bovis TaxID=28903 RepID=A0A2N8U1Z0_MYCBV|nr:ABC transporter permease subunit [Mycoplasmopsis bovis]AEI89966.1 glycerol ABC transporter, permease component [Mycoplasmopsis bovis Hubei-1]ADR25430.1 glycerol ABC transporter, permease protein GtsC [Mycoplasmopsis bovis PG45]AFM51641.1 glycerol ABC transporter permease component [Mycoplasmopsis bovis HB0801]AIA33841.1 Glycerol ABC transporter, permease component [Mycoplasmopsis bovis CQ-W70]AKO50468.1 ABC transporter permease [Mycoplasmopsis bovis]
MLLAKKIFFGILKFALIGLLCIMLLFPLYYLLLHSLVSPKTITDNKATLTIQEWNWSNYAEAYKKDFWVAFGYTSLFALFLMTLRIVTYSMAVAGLLKMNNRFQKIFQNFFLVISLVPEFSIYLSLKTFLIRLDLYGTAFSFVSNSIFSFFTFTYVWDLAKSAHNEKYKVMLNDNLKWNQKITYVYLPKLKLAYFLLIVFAFITAWNDYLWPTFVLPSTSNVKGFTNITIWFLNLGKESAEFENTAIQAAGAVISVLIPLTIYAIFSKKINRFN